MSYNINRANGTNFLVLNDNVVNRDYSVTFVGKMVPNYGQDINTNFLRLLENSASSSQPARPVVGQLWYDSNLKKLKFYNGTSFYTLDSIPPNTTGTTVYLSSNAQGDFIWVTANSIIGDVIVNLNNISGTTVIDRSRGNIFKAVATGNFLLSPTNFIAGQSFTLIVTQDATGSRKATYPGSFYFAMGFKELSTDPGSIDMINVFYDGTIFYATLTIEYVSAVSSTIITTTTTSAPIAITTTTTTAPGTYVVTNSGSGAYVINGANNPTISLIRGSTYTFIINAASPAPGHPFWIKSVSSIGTAPGNIYSSGVTNNGTNSGTITFIVPLTAPNTLYYNCEYHIAMAGQFNITGGLITTTTAAPVTTTAAPSVTLTMTVGGYNTGGSGDSGQTGFAAGTYGSLSPTTSSLWTGNIIALIHGFNDASGADGGYNNIELVFDTAQSYTGRYTIEIVGGLTVSASGGIGVNTNFIEPTGHPGTGPFVFGLSGTKTIRIRKGS